MSPQANRVTRQWVSLPGGSCDLRVGKGAIDIMGSVLKGSVGHPRLCALVTDATMQPEAVERVRRQLTDGGFRVFEVAAPTGAVARTLAQVEALSAKLAEIHVTSDDLVCAMGDIDMLSLCSFVCSAWCGGVPLAHIPTSLAASVEASTTPWGIDVAGAPQMLEARLGAKYQFCDLDSFDTDPRSSGAVRARALMATAALCDAENAVQRLWDRAELLVEGDEETLQEQLADTAKSRGRIVSSTSIATRQSVAFGQTFMRAVSSLAPELDEGLLIAEGVRFQARIAAAQKILQVDEVLTMDELLDLLALEPVSCNLDADELFEALRAERFLRSNRFILCLPRGYGRIRPASVEEDVLREHVAAWCASRASW